MRFLSLLPLISLALGSPVDLGPQNFSDRVEHLPLPSSTDKYFNWTAEWVIKNPDGRHPRRVIGINGEWPLPVVNVTKGDRVVVDLYNSLATQNVSLHFHGLFQNGTNAQDGPVYVTQCPQTFKDQHQFLRYNFTVEQSGTYWYHSHIDGQYPDGLRQAFYVNEPEETYKYDEHLMFSLSDWYHKEVPELMIDFLSKYNPVGNEPIPQTILLNDTQNSTFSVQPDKTYKISIVNVGAFVSQYVQFEDHPVEVIEVDGVNTEKSEPTELLYIASGQRYTVLLKTKSDGSRNFAISTAMDNTMLDSMSSMSGMDMGGMNKRDMDMSMPEMKSSKTMAMSMPKSMDMSSMDMSSMDMPSMSMNMPMPSNTPMKMGKQIPSGVVSITQTSYLVYNHSAPLTPPTHWYTSDNSTEDAAFKKKRFDDMNLIPLDRQPLLPDADHTIVLNVTMTTLEDGANYAFFNNVSYVPPKVPVLYTVFSSPNGLETNPEIYGNNSNVFLLKHNDVIDLVINNQDMSEHPFHLHGRNFQVPYRSSESDEKIVPFDPKDKKHFRPIPMRRDTVSVAPNGNLVIRYRADNPGVWFFHCHVEWHMSQGLALILVESPTLIKQHQTVPENHLQMCELGEVPTSGNAAAETHNWLDLSQQNLQMPFKMGGMKM